MSEEKPKIACLPNGPYYLLGLKILEAPMIFNPSRNRYEFILNNVIENLDGRRLVIQTDEGGADNVNIK